MKRKITLFFTIAFLFSLQSKATVTDASKIKTEPLLPAVVNCAVPLNVITSNITSTSVNFSWTAGTGDLSVFFYQYCIVSNQIPVVGPTTSTGTTGSSYFPLTPNTTYYIYVRSFCDGGVWGDWSVPASFTTPCDVAALPYLENFESATVGGVPGCTTSVNAGLGTNWTTVSNPGSGFVNNALQYTANAETANAWFFTKGVTLVQGTKYKISYKYGNNSQTTSEKLKVHGATAPNANSLIPGFDIGDFGNINTAVSQTYSVGPFIPFPGIDTYYFGFNAYSGANQGSLYLDDIVVEEWVCGTPVSPTVSEMTQNGATISWGLPGGNSVQVYQYVVSAIEATPSTGEYWPATSITLNTLQPETTYHVYVRAMCSGVFSPWSETVSFTTSPSTLTVSDLAFIGFSAYPNPTNDLVKLSNNATIDSVEIFNSLGQNIFSQKYNDLNVQVNMANFSQGCYFMTVHSGESTKKVQLIKK